MKKRGPRPKKIVDTTWTPNLAYAVGLLVTDGCIGKNSISIDLTSKDKEQLHNFNKCLGTKIKIGRKNSVGGHSGWRIQLKNRLFYDFLVSIGFTPAKSKTIGEIKLPDKYFFHFLRGSFDGDGTFYSYFDKRWKSSFMFYTEFVSASEKHLFWLRKQNLKLLGINGHTTKSKNSSVYHLKYAKKESLKVIRAMYKEGEFLKRKRLKIEKVLAMIDESIGDY